MTVPKWTLTGMVVLLAAAGCGGGLDESSQQACDDTQKALRLYDEYKVGPEELRTVQLRAMEPKLREFAAPAAGDVKTSIEALADTIKEAGLDDRELITTLRPKFQAFETKFDAARATFTDACK